MQVKPENGLHKSGENNTYIEKNIILSSGRQTTDEKMMMIMMIKILKTLRTVSTLAVESI